MSAQAARPALVRLRGIAGIPGAGSGRLPAGLDLRAISIVEGVRAGLAAALPVAASVWLAQPVLTLAALGALLTCICDPAGPMRRRLPVLGSFIGLGGLFLSAFGLLRAAGIAPTLTVAIPCLFACAYLRVWGQATQALGSLLAVLLILGCDEALPLRDAARAGGAFMAGGLWALLLTFVIWRIHPYGPARRAVADCWAGLARLARMIGQLCEQDEGEAAWEAQASAGRGAVRAALEHARSTLMATLTVRGPSSGPAAQNLLRLESADQVFAALIGVSSLLEQAPGADRAAAAPALRRLRALLTLLAHATEREHLHRAARFERTLATFTHGAALPETIRKPLCLLADRLRVATRYIEPAQYLPGSGLQAEAGLPLSARIREPMLANLSWRSATLRHTIRITVVVSLALAGTLIWHTPYNHWLTITLVLVMQPFFAMTRQRSLERVAAALLGGAFTALLSALASSTMHVAGLLPVLGALALAFRQVSVGAYTAIYTPTVILLVESMHPQESPWRMALSRASFTIAGGLLAVAANYLLWPSWEPDRVHEDLRAALTAHAAYASAVLGPETGNSARARRSVGLASNNLEASLARMMHEPHRGGRDRLQAILVADAGLRRIAGRIAALDLLGVRGGPVADWIVDGLTALAEDRPLPHGPNGGDGEMLDRLARHVSALAETLSKTR